METSNDGVIVIVIVKKPARRWMCWHSKITIMLLRVRSCDTKHLALYATSCRQGHDSHAPPRRLQKSIPQIPRGSCSQRRGCRPKHSLERSGSPTKRLLAAAAYAATLTDTTSKHERGEMAISTCETARVNSTPHRMRSCTQDFFSHACALAQELTETQESSLSVSLKVISSSS